MLTSLGVTRYRKSYFGNAPPKKSKIYEIGNGKKLTPFATLTGKTLK